VDKTAYKELVGEGIKIVKFYRDGCPPCRAMSPVLASIQSERPDITIIDIDGIEEWEVARDLRIMAVPVILIYKSGNEVARFVGLTSKEDIVKALIKNEMGDQ